MSEIGFSYAVFPSNSLEEQANEQGYTLGEDADTFEKIRKAINMCMFHVTTESQVTAMTKKLHNKVVKKLKLMNKE